MRRVITVSLNGNAYQLEDDAYAVLADYLEDASRALAGNPDRDEIIADLEQAIADKCQGYLSPHRSVLARAEIAVVIAAMGPVDGEAGPAAAAAAGPADPLANRGAAGASPSAEAPKRLYQISEGALVSGVCNGIAAYLGADVTIVRLVFVLLVFLSGGAALLAYLVLMFVVPYASTSEEHAAARGLPFNARVLVERAKQKAAQFTQGGDWRRSRAEWRSEWRKSRDAWRADWRRARAEWRAHRRAGRAAAYAAPPARTPYLAHVVTGSLLAVLGLVLAVFTIAWVFALVSLVTVGTVFGWALPASVPFWVALVVLVVVYNLVAWPIKAARHAAYAPGGGYHGPWVAAWDGVMGLALLAALAWYGYQHVPALHDFIDHVTRAWDHASVSV